MLDRKIRYCSLPEAIREHFLWGARSIVIAGTHGKTTTTSLTGWLLTHGGVDPSVLVGGIARNFGEHGSSYRLGQGRDFVIEGDEYDSAFFDKTAKFLKYLPDIAVINNVEFDHADIYADLDAVTLAFRRLVNLVPRRGLLLLGADSPGARALTGRRRVARRRRSAPARTSTGRRTTCEPAGASTRFQRPARTGRRSATFEVPLVGAHNVRNALAAIAVAAEVGIGAGAHRRGAARVRRRQAPARSRRASPAASRSTTTSRTIRPRSPRRWPGCARRIPTRASGRCSSRGRPRRAGASSRTTSRARSPAPTRC